MRPPMQGSQSAISEMGRPAVISDDMSDAVSETMQVGKPATDPAPRRRVVGLVVAVAAVLAGGALAGSRAGWFDNDADADAPQVITHPVPSNPRALTAAILTHIPDGVTVVWSSASADLADGTPGIGPAATLRKSLTSSILMRVGRNEFFLSVVTGPSNQAMVPDSLGHGLFTRDQQGRVVNEMVAGSARGNPTLVSESASPKSRGNLPLSDADLKAILADPLVGVQTDAATLARARTLSSYAASPPPLIWQP
jgi:hypothetical protein